MSEKIFLKLNLDFIVAEIRVFGSVGVYACVCESKLWPLLFFRQISEAILIPKIYARLQKIASNFSKFFGGRPPRPPAGARFGASPPHRAPFSKSPGSAPAVHTHAVLIYRPRKTDRLSWPRGRLSWPNTNSNTMKSQVLSPVTTSSQRTEKSYL